MDRHGPFHDARVFENKVAVDLIASMPRLLRSHGLFVLWAVCLLAAAVITLDPNVPVAGYNPYLAVALTTFWTAVSFRVAMLGYERFELMGRLADLDSAIAFIVLGVSNVLVRFALTATPLNGAYVGLYLHLVAGVVLVLPLVLEKGRVPAERRRPQIGRHALWTGAAVVVPLAALAAIRPSLPALIGPKGLALLASHSLLRGILPGQTPFLLVSDLALTALMAVAVVGYLRFARAFADAHFSVLATALTLLFFGYLTTVVFPGGAPSYVGITDFFRLFAYIAIVVSMVQGMRRSIEDEARRAERLRLSREIHDGLAQELSLLRLKLAQARRSDRPPERRRADLEAGLRLVDRVLVETRQSIDVLTEESRSLARVRHALATFGDEFSKNHEVEVVVEASIDEAAATVDSAVEGDLLRLALEAFSNAIRHGGAHKIALQLTSRGDGLELVIRDDGRGFDPAGSAALAGYGLKSMAERAAKYGGAFEIRSKGGEGTCITFRAPVVQEATP